MSTKITEIQRGLRREIQQRRIDLESEIKRLRKLIRNQQNDDDSDPLDTNDEDLEIEAPVKRRKRGTAIHI